MEIVSVTIGLPVTDLAESIDWYRRVLELPEPDLEPAEGVVEWRVGPVWLQLMEAEGASTGCSAVLRLGVADVRARREQLLAAGVDVGAVEHVPGAVDYVDVTDPDGNTLSLYTELD